MRLGTATPGGGFPVYGAAFVEAVHRFDPGLEIEAINTKGSTENVPMLEAGTLDIALVQGEVVHEVAVRHRPAAGRSQDRHGDVSHRRHVRGARRLSLPPITDLQGKPIAWGAQGSGLVILGRYVMDGLGLDAAKDFQPIYLERAGDGPAMVLDGRAAALWGGGAGWPGFTTVAKSEKGARFIAPDADEIQRILAKHSFLKPVTQAAGSFPGQDAAIPSVGSWSFVMARPGLDDGRGLPHRQGAARAGKSRQCAPATGRHHGEKHACRRAARAPASRCRTLFPRGRPPVAAVTLRASRRFLGWQPKERVDG